jgi:hypothetical protein
MEGRYHPYTRRRLVWDGWSYGFKGGGSRGLTVVTGCSRYPRVAAPDSSMLWLIAHAASRWWHPLSTLATRSPQQQLLGACSVWVWRAMPNSLDRRRWCLLAFSDRSNGGLGGLQPPYSQELYWNLIDDKRGKKKRRKNTWRRRNNRCQVFANSRYRVATYSLQQEHERIIQDKSTVITYLRYIESLGFRLEQLHCTYRATNAPWARDGIFPPPGLIYLKKK